MKIAVVEWHPRVCGVHTCALSIADGIASLGHEV